MPVTLLLAGPERLYPTASFWYMLLALQTLAAAAFYLRTQYHAATPRLLADGAAAVHGDCRRWRVEYRGAELGIARAADAAGADGRCR